MYQQKSCVFDKLSREIELRVHGSIVHGFERQLAEIHKVLPQWRRASTDTRGFDTEGLKTSDRGIILLVAAGLDMNFLGLGPGELILVAILGLIVFGPGKLPEIAGQIGRVVRDFRRSTSEISSEFQRSFSLDEAKLSKEVDGPAAASATNETTTAAIPEAEAADARSEPALADTSDWHWEDSQSPQPASPTAAETSHGSDSFWQWDQPPETEVSSTPAKADRDQAADSRPAEVWRWDDSDDRASASKSGRTG